MGTPTGNTAAIPALPNNGDYTDWLLKGRQAAMRTIAARRGQASTFLSIPSTGTSSLLGGGIGSTGNGTGNTGGA